MRGADGGTFQNVCSLSAFWVGLLYDEISLNLANDLIKDWDYINYFMGLDVVIDYGQGTFYYYLISLFFQRKIVMLDETNIDILLSYSVQQVNLFFYLIGILGAFQLLKLKRFSCHINILSIPIYKIHWNF